MDKGRMLTAEELAAIRSGAMGPTEAATLLLAHVTAQAAALTPMECGHLPRDMYPGPRPYCDGCHMWEEVERLTHEAAKVRRENAAQAEEIARVKSGREHCPSCICGKRAPVQADHYSRPKPARGPGSITWAEHLLAWSGYAHENGRGQTAQRMAERGGFSYHELTVYLGREPTTWEGRT